MMDRKHCVGCRQDFYNGNNDLGVQECWRLKTAKIIWRKRVSMSQRPPWKQKAIRKPDCYWQAGYVFVGPKQQY